MAEAGIPLFDADAEVRRMQSYGGSLVEAIDSRFPGTIVLEFLPLIPSGLPRKAFQERLQTDIETATAKLVAEGRKRLSASADLSAS